MPAHPNRRAKATVDAIDAILGDGEPETDGQDPVRAERPLVGPKPRSLSGRASQYLVSPT